MSKRKPARASKRAARASNVTAIVAAPMSRTTIIAAVSAQDRVPPVEEVVSGIFETDAAVRSVIADNLRDRHQLAKVVTLKAHEAFAEFTPTKYAATSAPRPNYVKPGESATSVQKRAMQRGVEAIQKSSVPRSIKFSKTPELSALMKTARPNNGSLAGTITATDMVAFVTNKIGRNLYLVPDTYTICKAELEAEKRLKEIEAGKGPATFTASNGSNPPAASSDGTEVRDASHLTATMMVKDNVDLQMSKVTAPESQLTFEVPDRSQQAVDAHDTPSFELRKGASDVTSYHDFHNLQIAFEDVWTEMFDTRVSGLGRQLYEEYAHLKDFNGVEAGNVKKLKTIDDLRSLMDEIRDFSRLTDANTPKPIFSTIGAALTGSAPTPTKVPEAADSLGRSSRLTELLEGLDKILDEKRYAFDVFAPNSMNFGVMITYRQKWEPLNYQVGDLVSTIPLAPKEIRRYTTRKVVKRTRASKEVDDSLQIRKSESADTARVDSEIVAKTLNKNSFNIMAHESIGGGEMPYTVESTQTADTSSAQDSQQTKKDFRESVMKSAQEYKQEHKLEIDTTESSETEDTTFHEIQNPNDELAVTYLFYELQRTYRISEKLHKLTPVVLVANEVPAPHEITDAWLMQHDWILNHAILDDSFRPAIEYLTKSLVGAELNIRILEDNALLQKGLVDKLTQQVQSDDRVLANAEEGIRKAVQNVADAKSSDGLLSTIKSVFDPLKITGQVDTGAVPAAQIMLDFAKDTLDRAEKEKNRLEAQLQTAVTALQSAVNNLSAAVKEHYNNLISLDRLRVHVKDNILYYMQAIWSHEPPDQRFFRLYNLDAPKITPDATTAVIQLYEIESALNKARNALGGIFGSIPMPNLSFSTEKLVHVADLDNMLGFKGNYMIFPLKKSNFLTMHMMQDYLEIGDDVTLRDPDEFGDYTLDDLQELATCLKQRDPAAWKDHKEDFKKMMIDRLSSGRLENEMVIVPTTSLYIEALVGTHPLLEDFKLIHRALDVKKVQAEVRHAELENIRLASRVLKGKDDDPDIDKKIVIETDKHVTIQPDVG
jgi:hypothetical protein